MWQHLAKDQNLTLFLFLPETTRQSARVWLKTMTSTFAATTLRANLTLATNIKKLDLGNNYKET